MGKQITIQGYKTKCGLCGQKFTGLTKTEVEAARDAHECKVETRLRKLESDGLLDRAIIIMRANIIDKKVTKLVKDFGYDAVAESLEEHRP